MNWLEACVRWYVVVALCTWAFAPAIRWLCAGLCDRGASIARPISLLVALYPAWLLASLHLTEFRPEIVIAVAAVSGLLGWGALLCHSAIDRSWLRRLLASEAATLVLFTAYVWLRGFTPQILGTEKPMDIAFLASSSRAMAMPPPDPWFAGQPINYYYLGYLIHGTIGRIAGVPAEIGFNLALATIFSMTTVAAFGTAWNVLRAMVSTRQATFGGLIAAFLVSLAGNLYAPLRLLQQPIETVHAWWWDSGAGIGWRSSRIICDGPRTGNLCQFPSVETINEFPFFSFLLGDLHPHLMALPFTIVAIALSWNVIGFLTAEPGEPRRSVFAKVVIIGAVSGSLYGLNAWDFPTFLLLVALGVIVGAAGSARAWQYVMALVVAAVLAWLPFALTYAPPTIAAAGGSGAAGHVPSFARLLAIAMPQLGERTSIGEYLTIFGMPYAIGLLLVLSSYAALLDRGSWRFPAIVTAIAVISGIVLSAPLLPLCGIPITLAIGVIANNPSRSPQTFALSLFSLAWLISIGVEFFYLRDVFENRMNTLFKFYYQTWTLYAVAAGIAVVLLWRQVRQRKLLRPAAASLITLMILAGLTYPVLAIYQWTDGFSNWRGLDGLAYGEDSDPDDVAAIRWLASHGGAGDVVLEAAGCSYRPFNRLPFDRVSAFTGIPTVIGWDGHEQQWRAGQPGTLREIAKRQDDVAEMFANPASALFDTYGVTWLFVGSYEADDWRGECKVAGPYANVEASGYPGTGWQEAFRSGDTRIYKRAGA